MIGDNTIRRGMVTGTFDLKEQFEEVLDLMEKIQTEEDYKVQSITLKFDDMDFCHYQFVLEENNE